MILRTWNFVIPIVVLLVVANEGCSIFQPVGNVITTGYDNFVAYFNVYYNASKLFDEAEEEIVRDAQQKRGKEQSASSQSKIPQSASQKLTKVVDKCSYILAFHQKSSFIDDALLLIGKSFYYQGQFERAERKFVELLTQFPESDLCPETQVWYARSLYQQKKYSEALEVGRSFLETWRGDTYRNFAMKVHMLVGEIYEQLKEYHLASEHYGVVVDQGDDEERRVAFMKLGDVAALEEKFEQASQWYTKACESGEDDPYFLSVNTLKAAQALQNAGHHQLALQVLNDALLNFRLKDYRGQFYLERGRTYVALRETSEAREDFALVDTGYTNSPWSAIAAFELGKMYEHILMDYSNALQSYTRATKSTEKAVADSARQKMKVLTRYFDIRSRLNRADSLYTLYSTVSAVSNDSLSKISLDSVGQVAKKQEISLDSIRTIRFTALQELADAFFGELNIPDSAAWYYLRAIEECRDSSLLPRMYYMLAVLAQAQPLVTPRSAEEYYQYIVRSFPQSPYAKAAQRALGEVLVERDPAEDLYIQAESVLNANDYRKALTLFAAIESEYPLSPYAAKSAYARAWLYEHVFGMYDSARTLYRTIRKRYPSTVFASRAEELVLDSSEVTTAPIDTIQGRKVAPQLRSSESRSTKLQESPVKEEPLEKPVDVRDRPSQPSMRKPPIEENEDEQSSDE